MRERNKYILVKGISNLPEHKAPAEIWDNIETAHFDIPTAILPMHKAPSKLWEGIYTGLVNRNSLRKVINRSLIAALLLLLVGFGSYFLFFDGLEVDNIQNNTPNTSTLIIDDNATEKEQKDESIIVNPGNSGSSKSGNKVIYKKQLRPVNKPVSSNTNVTKKNKTNYSTPTQQYYNNKELIGYSESRLSTSQSRLKSKRNLNNITKNPDYIDINSLPKSNGNFNERYNSYGYCDFNRVNKDIYLGATISYEKFLESTIPKNTEIKYWFSGDLRLKFKRERLSIEIGVGIGYSVDKTVFSYNYLTNELIDTYEYVDSVHFDPVTGTTEYFTTTVNVYDSIAYASNSAVEKEYMYLHIPLVLGYEVLNRNDFSINIMAGMSFLSQISVTNKIPSLHHENSRITNINSVESVRNTQFFNSSFAIGFGWNINKNMTLNVDPKVNYYFSNIYQQSELSSNSISLGLKCGIYIKF
jgi:outer membrane protein with beta-barrel domain